MTSSEKVELAKSMMKGCPCGCENKRLTDACPECWTIICDVDAMGPCDPEPPKVATLETSMLIPEGAKPGDVVAVMLTKSDWDTLRGIIADNPEVEAAMKAANIMKTEVELY